jgi:acetyl esterase/lipase
MTADLTSAPARRDTSQLQLLGVPRRPLSPLPPGSDVALSYDIRALTLGGHPSWRATNRRSARPAATLIYFGNGGWVLGSLAASEGSARRLAAATCSIVVRPPY